MHATRPKQIEVQPTDPAEYGKFFYGCCKNTALEHESGAEAEIGRQNLLAGRLSFLFDAAGNFHEWKFD
jgi:hypothetical protein